MVELTEWSAQAPEGTLSESEPWAACHIRGEAELEGHILTLYTMDGMRSPFPNRHLELPEGLAAKMARGVRIEITGEIRQMEETGEVWHALDLWVKVPGQFCDDRYTFWV